MNAHSTTEIRELNVEELEAVTGGWLATFIGIAIPILITPGKQTMQEWVAEHT